MCAMWWYKKRGPRGAQILEALLGVEGYFVFKPGYPLFQHRPTYVTPDDIANDVDTCDSRITRL